MWHITTAEVFSDDNQDQPVAVIHRNGGGRYVVTVEPGRVLPASTIQPSEDGTFASFDDALAFTVGG